MEDKYRSSLLEFVKNNRDKEISNILLHTKVDTLDFDLKYACKLIEAKAKLKHKFPQWYNNEELIFISSISSEQSSSFQTAEHKSNYIKDSIVLDLTGGIGIDSYFFSLNNRVIYYNERDVNLMQATQYNFKKLNIFNVNFSSLSIDKENIEEYLLKICVDNSISKIPFVYIDPARRAKTGCRLKGIEDYEPNILSFLEILYKYSDKIIVKISPMEDISTIFNSLPLIEKIDIVSVNNECKELLLFISNPISKEYDNLLLSAINITPEYKQVTEFSIYQEREAIVKYMSDESLLEHYLYDPNSSILKSGGFKIISQLFSIEKLDKNTHLYSSKNYISDFPGRIFKIEEVIEFKSKNINNLYKNYPKANIISKNLPFNSQSLKQRLRIDDGGDIYIFGCTINLSKKLLICKRLNNF